MKVKYLLIEDSSEDENGRIRTSYGIEIILDGVRMRSIRDVYTDRAAAQMLIDRCNRLRLSPVHIDDVLENEI